MVLLQKFFHLWYNALVNDIQKDFMVIKMKNRIIGFGSVVMTLSICFTVFSVGLKAEKTDITTANLKTFYAEKEESTTSNALGGIVNDVFGDIGSASPSDKVDGVLGSIDGVSGDIENAIGGFGDSMDSLGGIGDVFGGFGDALGGVGDSLGGIFGGLGGSGSGTAGNTTAPVQTTSPDVGIIIPVPAATQKPSEPMIVSVPSTSVETGVEGETVDYANTSNPYTKPTDAFVAGDEDETIKWIQWIFIYSGYGLNDNGITGVLDEDTVAVVKKLQHENKLTVDGNINEDVIKAAEVLYYKSILGEDVSAIEIASNATTGENVSKPVDYSEGGDNSTVILLIIILVIIWVLAIGGIVLLFIFKKKKINAVKQAEAQKDNNEKEDSKKTEISSLSDLFEEAERKDK